MSPTEFISICPRQFGLDGPVLLRAGPRSTLRTAERRLAKTQTLDGGTAVRDSGFVDGDRTMTVLPLDLTAADAAAIEALARSYSALSISTAEAVFEGSIERYLLDSASPSITIAIYRRLSE